MVKVWLMQEFDGSNSIVSTSQLLSTARNGTRIKILMNVHEQTISNGVYDAI